MQNEKETENRDSVSNNYEDKGQVGDMHGTR